MRRSYRQRALPRHHRPGPRRDARTPRSPPTSSSASPARPRRTSRQTLDVVRAGPVRRRVHLPVLQAPRHAGRDDGRPGAARRSSRSATSGWSRSQDEIAWAENQALVGRDGRGAGRRGRGPQGRRHPPAVRPRPRQPAGALRAPARPAPRPGDVVDGRGHLRRAAPPGRRRRRSLAVRRTRAGDAWEARQRAAAGPARRRRAARAADRRCPRRACPRSGCALTVLPSPFCPCPAGARARRSPGRRAPSSTTSGLPATPRSRGSCARADAERLVVGRSGPDRAVPTAARVGRSPGSASARRRRRRRRPARGAVALAPATLGGRVAARPCRRARRRGATSRSATDADGARRAARRLGVRRVGRAGHGRRHRRATRARAAARTTRGAEPYDDAVVAALGAATLSALAALDPAEGQRLAGRRSAGVAGGRPALRVARRSWTAPLLARDAPVRRRLPRRALDMTRLDRRGRRSRSPSSARPPPASPTSRVDAGASALGGEVVNADSMQLYRGMDIGTAKLAAGRAARRPAPPARRLGRARGGERRRVPAAGPRGVDRLPRAGRGPGAGRRLRRCTSRAVLDRLEFPGTDPGVRARLEAELAAVGPGGAARPAGRASTRRRPRAILPSNGRRIVRALEVVELTGRPFSATLPEPAYARTRRVQVGARTRPRPVLDERIERAGRPDVGRRAWSTRCAGWRRRAARGPDRVAGRSATPRCCATSTASSTRTQARRRDGRGDPAVRPAAGVVVPARPADPLAAPTTTPGLVGSALATLASSDPAT